MGEVESLAISMNQRMRAVPGESEILEPAIICRVPKSIREVDPKAFDPKMISIGHFHRDKKALRPMQELKWRFLSDLIGRHPDNSVEKCITVVKSVEPRKYYSEPVPDNNPFLEMMVLDGCFIIEFILKVVLDSIDDQPFSVTSNLHRILLDLMLLENQIPFLVLECLFSETRGVPEGLGTLKDTAALFLFKYYDPLGTYDENPTPDVVHHLLHLFDSFLHPSPWRSTLRSDTSSNVHWSVKELLMNKPKYILSNCFFSIVSLFVTLRPPRRRAAYRILSASSLREAGVKFCINEHARFFFYVTFRNGRLKIPYTMIAENTVLLFRNLLAFDQCNLSHSDFSSYVALMSSLIQKPEDVKLLEDSVVLECLLSGPEEVARFFATLDKGSIVPGLNHYFGGLFKELNEYCAKDRHRWKAKLKHDYFSNPWSLISVIAAFVLLVLTIVQTLYTVFAYYRPS